MISPIGKLIRVEALHYQDLEDGYSAIYEFIDPDKIVQISYVGEAKADGEMTPVSNVVIPEGGVLLRGTPHDVAEELRAESMLTLEAKAILYGWD